MVPAIGQGCGRIGLSENRGHISEAEEIYALQYGIDIGMTFIDTAEVYGEGNSEILVGRALSGRREKAFLATKFSPENSSYKDVVSSLENSLRRLQTDYIDLYQAHWPNPSIPIEETMRALAKLRADGKVKNIGLSNFSKREFMQAQASLTDFSIVSNQVELNLVDRFAEQELLPFLQSNGSTLIAYSPLDKGRNASGDPREVVLSRLSKKYEKTTSQIALCWLISQSNVMAIPGSSNTNHLEENAMVMGLELEKSELDEIDEIFRPKPVDIPCESIRVSLSGEGGKLVYQTRAEAIENHLNLVPSPLELASYIKAGDSVKPVRLIPSTEKNSGFKYDLVEGRLRYWAWVLAFDGAQPVPAYVRY
jgi:diketogulonate reductase-like aldo/keto reductase